MVSVTVQTEQTDQTEQAEQTEQTEQPPHVRYTIRLQNAYDRPLGGSFTLQVNGQDVQVPAQASASELAALLRVEIENDKNDKNDMNDKNSMNSMNNMNNKNNDPGVSLNDSCFGLLFLAFLF